ncbi:MAG: L,D-transpeptidase [Bacteriovorax sp.]
MVGKQLLVFSGIGAFLLLAIPAYSEINFSNSMELVIPASAINKVIGVRISDIVSSYPSLIPGLANLSEQLKKSPENFFKLGKIEVLHDVFMNRMPEVNGREVRLHLVGFVKYKDQNINFEKITVTYSNIAKAASDVFIQTEAIIPLKEMMFQVSVGLVERKVIIEDKTKDVKLVFPVGVGAFDEGVMNEGAVSLVTPRFKHGVIDQRAVISKRETPRYFRGLPFIRVLKGPDLLLDSTAIGFHIEINDSFVRGFDSHGCMRLREADLMAFHDLIMLGAVVQTPITIQYRTEDQADHPATKRNQIYKTILNKGTSASPFFIYDRDNLVQMVYKEDTQAPVEKLIDQKNDDYYDLFNYETAEQVKEQDERRKNECDAKVMRGELSSDQKKYQACLDEGKRQDSLKDRIYRKFMGIDDPASTGENFSSLDKF